jgi:hypothetical protein
VERTDRIVQCRAGYNRIWCDSALCVLEQERRGEGSAWCDLSEPTAGR